MWGLQGFQALAQEWLSRNLGSVARHELRTESVAAGGRVPAREPTILTPRRGIEDSDVWARAPIPIAKGWLRSKTSSSAKRGFQN